MNRCLDLALLGLGSTAPNPLVGSVVVYNSRIIGEGYHRRYGDPHAEVNAIDSVKDKSLLKGSTIYVNLEPCSHMGKTPPCADMIIRSKIPEVMIGTVDPNPLVSGKGIAKLKKAGVRVITGILEPRCYEINKRFFTYHRLKRPFVILKWAETADGFIDILREKPEITHPTWISNDISRMLVHKWRSEEQAILIGTQTALMDNPRLTVREWPGGSPIRMVIDRKLRLPRQLKVLDHAAATVIFNEITDKQEGNLRYVQLDFRGNIPEQVMQKLYVMGIQSLIIEGGRKLLESFISKNLWDEARIFTGAKIFGAGVQAPSIQCDNITEHIIFEDRLRICKNY
jgi:diaminohydroxyphosphoribosylaminopyrimidine deaminase/5-amino-6-(5-phosphoribosylamino)uracil reductase